MLGYEYKSRRASHQLVAERARRKRLRLLPIAALILMSILGLKGAPKNLPTYFVEEETYVVAEGDSLWRIASAYSGPDEDVRFVVDRILKDNALQNGADLRPGDRLKIYTRHELH